MQRTRKSTPDCDPVLDDPILRARYVIEGLLGRGGSGAVYRAIQKATGQTVALKTFDAVGKSSNAGARFTREARLCASLHHPHIVRIIDAHEGEAGLWSVFEWVPGEDLARVIAAEGRLEPFEAVRMMAQVLDALSAAHARGIVHRDIKPANIMVSATGARRNASVLDFGIGALVEEATAEEVELDAARVTQTGEFIGTPAYAAPEQLRGDQPTARTDLYAWALTFVECVTGRRLVDGRTLSHVLVQHLRAEPLALPPPLAGHRLAPLLERALDKDVARREVTAESLLSALDGLDRAEIRALGGGAFGGTSGAAGDTTLSTVASPTLWQPVAPGRVTPVGPADRAFLSRVPLLRRLASDELDRLMAIMERRALAAGEVLAEIAAPGFDAFIVREGGLALELPGDGEARLVARCGSGEVVGELCLVEPAPRTLRMRAEGPVTVYAIDGRRFATLRDADDPGAHKVLRAITATLCERLRENTERLQATLQGRATAVTGGFAVPEETAASDGAWDRLKRLWGRI